LNTPKLRFDGFSEEWVSRTLEEYAHVQTGPFGSQLHESDYVSEGTPIITVEHFGDNYIIHSNLPLVSDEDVKRLKKYTLSEGDIVFSRVGSVDRRVYVTKREDGWLFSGRCLRLSTTSKKVDSKFLSFYLGTTKCLNEIRSKAVGGTMPSLNTAILNSIGISIPSIEEQKKISDFLTLLDKKIQKQQEKVELLKQQKKGLMQRIFSQELRFKDESGQEYPEWASQTMNDVISTYSGGTPSVKNREYYKGTIPFIRSGEIYKDTTELYVNESALQYSSAKLVRKGDLLYALYGATSGEVSISKIDGAINQAILCIRTSEVREFLLYFFENSKDRILSTYLQGGQGNLSAQIIKSINIEIPCKLEQLAISNFLDSISVKITQEDKKLSLLIKQKQAFMQQMFI